MTVSTTTRLPDFVVLGQGKAGTSLIYNVLGQNPSIGLSTPKELHFFSACFKRGVDWYSQHFAEIPETADLVGEVAPSYLSAQAVRRLAGTLGRETKVIFVLRRPIEQAYSRYLQNICADQRPGPFPKSPQALTRRLENVYDALSECYRLFDRNNILPLSFEMDVAGSDPQFENQILEFLGLPPADFSRPFIQGKTVNPGVMPRYLFSRDKALTLSEGRETFVLPPNNLVFCGQQRNSWVKADPSVDEVLDAMSRQSSWTPGLSEEEYGRLQNDVVLQASQRFGDAFGLDLSHWRNPPHDIIYNSAPPPKTLLQEGNGSKHDV